MIRSRKVAVHSPPVILDDDLEKRWNLNAMSCGRDDEQQHLLASLQKRAAAGQVDRRGFLHLATAIGLEAGFAAGLADQAMAAPHIQGQGGGSIDPAYDYIVVGAGSAGCTIAARLSENAACRVLLVEAGGADISRSALQSPVLWSSNFGTDVDWAYRTIPQPKAAGRIIDWPRGKIIGGSSSINAMIWVWGHAADFDQWAYAGSYGWDYARLKPVFQSIETSARPRHDKPARGRRIHHAGDHQRQYKCAHHRHCGASGTNDAAAAQLSPLKNP